LLQNRQKVQLLLKKVQKTYHIIMKCVVDNISYKNLISKHFQLSFFISTLLVNKRSRLLIPHALLLSRWLQWCHTS